jgi:outer membrane protein
MTLADAFALAQAKDAKLASSQSKLEADEELTDQALSQLLPQLTASANVRQEAYKLPTSALSFDERTNNKNVQVTQALYNRQAISAYDQAGLKVNYARLRLSSAQQELGVRVTQAYLNVLLAQENIALSKSLFQSTEQRLKQVTAALKVGYSTKVDRFSLKAELDDAKSKLLSDEQQLIFFRQKLKGLIGQDPPKQLPWPLLKADALISRFLNAHDWLSEAKNRNLDVQMSRAGVEVAQQEVEVRSSSFYPVINLGAYYSEADGATYFAQKQDNKVVYLEMKLPLYQGGYDSSRVREGKALLRTAEFDAEYYSREATQQAQEQLSNVTSSREKIEALAQAIISGESYLASVEEGYRLGVRDIAELSRAKEKLFINRRDQVRATVELLNSLVQLHAVSGLLDEQAMAQISHSVW